jgi:hypothetical protein
MFCDYPARVRRFAPLADKVGWETWELAQSLRPRASTSNKGEISMSLIVLTK